MKTNLTKKSIAEYKRLVKQTKTGHNRVEMTNDGLYLVEIISNGEEETFTTGVWKEVTEAVDSRNWSTTLENIDIVVEAIVEEKVCTRKEIVVPQIVIDTVDESDMPIGHIVPTEEIQANWEATPDYESIAELEDTYYAGHICYNIAEMVTIDGREADRATYHVTKSEMFRVLAEAGMTTANIAKVFKTHYSYVHGVLKRANMSRPQKTATSNVHSKKQQIIDLYTQQFTTRAIAETLETHISYVRTTIAAYKKSQGGVN